MPSQIQRVFRIDFGIEISLTTIVNWIEVVREPLREMLRTTPVPSSGYWGYDEIHLRINKERMYAIDTMDVITRFVPVAKISENMDRNAGRKVLMEGRTVSYGLRFLFILTAFFYLIIFLNKTDSLTFFYYSLYR